jgi:hypothetical protein
MFQIYPNGGGKVLHAWQEDLDRLSEEENQAFAEEFVTESFRNGRPGPIQLTGYYYSKQCCGAENISSGYAEPQRRIVALAPAPNNFKDILGITCLDLSIITFYME